jgi:hypothetical protein
MEGLFELSDSPFSFGRLIGVHDAPKLSIGVSRWNASFLDLRSQGGVKVPTGGNSLWD